MNPNFDKRTYKYLKKEAKQLGVVLAQDEEYGVTIAYVPAVKGPDCVMLEVAVAYCAEDDEFSKKHGKFTVLDNFFNLEVVKIPLAWKLRVYGEEAVSADLLYMFSV